MSERVPAECFPVGQFIGDEMQARGWSSHDMAARMGDGDPATWALTVELLVACSDDPAVTLDVDTAQRIGRAFGTSADLWLNLHRTYLACRKCHSENS